MEYEWDEAKASHNLTRHGIDFMDAIGVFEDPLRLELRDDRYDYGETRYCTIGIVQDTVLIVVFTYRADAIRVISAQGCKP